jgi:hypothetical protein
MMEKSALPNEIMAFKMVGGQEVIAEVLETHYETVVTDGLGVRNGSISGWKVRRPHLLQFLPNGHGGVNLAFVPWTLSNPDIENVEIPREAVLLNFSPSVHAEKQYQQQTSSLDLSTAQAALTGGRISK